MVPDVVYVCREGAQNEELRYSLRSLANLPHGQVWIFGGIPSFINRETVNYVPVKQHEINFRNAATVKYENSRRNLWTACAHDGVSEHFIYMNDDFYVTEAIDRVPVYHYGSGSDFDAFFRTRQSVATNYVLAERATLKWLESQGIEDPKSYALHVPLPVVKAGMLAVLDAAPWNLDGHPLHMRTAYGNLNSIGGTKIRDVKVERGNRTGARRLNGVRINGPVAGHKSLPKPFASSSDRSFVAFEVGRWVRASFPHPSPYERS